MLPGVDYTLGFYAHAKLNIGTQRALLCREMTRYWRTWSSKSTGYGRKSCNVSISAGIRALERRYEGLRCCRGRHSLSKTRSI